MSNTGLPPCAPSSALTSRALFQITNNTSHDLEFDQVESRSRDEYRETRFEKEGDGEEPKKVCFSRRVLRRVFADPLIHSAAHLTSMGKLGEAITSPSPAASMRRAVTSYMAASEGAPSTERHRRVSANGCQSQIERLAQTILYGTNNMKSAQLGLQIPHLRERRTPSHRRTACGRVQQETGTTEKD